MTAAVFDTMNVKLGQNGVQFAANGSQVKFDGYLAIYNDSDKNKMLPDMEKGIQSSVSIPIQNSTLPSRLLVILKRLSSRLFLEENGVGRPSTYAPTIETIQKRYYVKLVSSALSRRN